MKHVYLVLTVFCFYGYAQTPEDFPQWDRTGWVVSAVPDTIIIPCAADKYYPFQNLALSGATNIQWILPESTSYIHVPSNTSYEGWHVYPNDTLIIKKQELNVPDAVIGQYVCAALAPVESQNNPNIVAWYYLKWGVGLYTDAPAMNSPADYSHKFLIAGISLLVFIVIAMIVLFTAACRIDEEPVDDIYTKDDDDFSLDDSDTKDEKRSNYSAV